MYKHQNTEISVHYITKRLDSWQAHLEDVSCYLVQGENAWWKWTDQGETVEFLDVNINGEHCEYPKLENYRTAGIKTMKAEKQGHGKK